MNAETAVVAQPRQTAVLDSGHGGDFVGAFGTIRVGDEALPSGMDSRLMTLLAIVGPGLIVMVGDTDAGAVSATIRDGLC